LEVIKQ